MNMYKAGCFVVAGGLVLGGCASTPAPTPLPCNCQPTRTVYVPVPVNKPVAKPVEKPVAAPAKTDANGATAVPVPPKKPSKIQKLREDIKRLKDEYLRKKSGEQPTNPDEFRG